MDAVQNEVAQTEVEIEWRGLKIAVPATLDDAPIEVMEAIEAGKGYQAAKYIVGPEKWAEIKATLKPTKRDIDELMDSISVQLGFTKTGE